ncbi:GNAT family N-acetyltransferase [Rhodocytophaga rosea]|uniref:Aminoglycoside N(6')-acetyltransferase type 1 n=1 Tax=Rhodocytophaga rosea TaxID=2704465 RepID=A0A6C0GCF9_9BACT|nr:aminoglycoside 6'-N-acetyltransferase [Rhodocytophaga rosea]QHT65645.1 GNAT family N-acetyltransferase [Rhodocytophaga rosea]
MHIERLSKDSLQALTVLMLELWPDCSFEEEYENNKEILRSGKETAFLYKVIKEDYIGFITVSLRTDYVEGAITSPVGYVEGIYVKPGYRQQGIGIQLLAAAEVWCKEKGCVEMGSDTELDNKLSQIFHQKAGFTEVNRIVCFKKDLR